MTHPFADAPDYLRSLNVARVMSLPADLASDDVVGRRGVELVSGLALTREIGARALELGLDPASPDLLRDFAARVNGPEAPGAVRVAAHDIAHRFGRRLGCLLLTLATGDTPSRTARPEWGDAQWAFWAGVRRVVIGGGLLAGAIGDVALPAAQEVLDGHGGGAMRLVRSPWADRIGLVGLARCLPVASDSRAVVDFGQTAVKLGLARYRAGVLDGVALLPARPGVCPSPIGLSSDRAEIERQWEAMLDLIVAVVDEAQTRVEEATTRVEEAPPGGDDVADVAISLACYLRDGNPDPYEVRSCYGRLQVLAPNLADFARRELEGRLGREVHLRVIHDGSAAALAVDPDEATVVLTVGTAMGVGFPLARDPRMPLAPGFSVDLALERRTGA